MALNIATHAESTDRLWPIVRPHREGYDGAGASKGDLQSIRRLGGHDVAARSTALLKIDLGCPFPVAALLWGRTGNASLT